MMAVQECFPWAGMGVGLALIFACGRAEPPADPEEAHWRVERQAMVDLVISYGIRDRAVLDALRKVRRHRFIPAAFRVPGEAYGDHPCAIGQGQTISQPYIVAYMTASLAIRAGEKILEIGTGSGYQAAILAELGGEVYSIEIVPELAEHARTVLAEEGYARVKVLTGDGFKGWPDAAPFDVIIVTCAPEEIPPELVKQLRDGGRMMVPVGERGFQRLVLLRKDSEGIRQQDDLPVRFVPMVRQP
jgi:protein-L-isoaspartate(D-aspartate) O-methyltransferase